MPGSVNAARSIVDITSKKRITIKIGTKRPILIVRNGRLKRNISVGKIVFGYSS